MIGSVIGASTARSQRHLPFRYAFNRFPLEYAETHQVSPLKVADGQTCGCVIVKWPVRQG
jgi:hypothetical protein